MVVDVQVGVVADDWRRAEIVNRIAALADRARAASVPVVWVRHSNASLIPGTDDWRLVPELAPRRDEHIVEKKYGDAFEDTDLESVLADKGIGHLVVCGAQSDACVVSTCFGALVRGWDVTLVGDAHTTCDRSGAGVRATPDAVIQEINLIWRNRTAPGRTCSVVTADSLWG